MMDRRKTGEVLFYMINCAIQDRESIIDAYSFDKTNEVVREAQKDIKSFLKIREKLFPNVLSKEESIMKNTKEVTLSEIRKVIDAN